MTNGERPVFAIPSDVDLRTMARPELRELPPSALFSGVQSHLDLQYAGPPGFRPLTLDLHVPDGAAERAVPVAVYAHGGGYFLGSRRMGPWRFLLEAGIAVASISYRFSGEAVFPAPVHDAVAAVRWVRAHAREYGLDSDLIVGFGSSAGAYLLSAVALMGEDPELGGHIGPVPGESCRLAAVVEHYGPTDILRMDEDALPGTVEAMLPAGSTMARFLGFAPLDEPDRADIARLTRYVTASAPPFLIIHGDDDHRVGPEQSRRLHRALTAAGVRAELVIVPGGDHGSAHFDEAAVHEAALAFVRSVLEPS